MSDEQHRRPRVTATEVLMAREDFDRQVRILDPAFRFDSQRDQEIADIERTLRPGHMRSPHLHRGWGDCVDSNAELSAFLKRCRRMDEGEMISHVSTSLLDAAPGVQVSRLWAGDQDKERCSKKEWIESKLGELERERMTRIRLNEYAMRERRVQVVHDTTRRQSHLLIDRPAHHLPFTLPFFYNLPGRLRTRPMPRPEDVVDRFVEDLSFQLVKVRLEEYAGQVLASWDERDAEAANLKNGEVASMIRRFVMSAGEVE